jgi:Helix-turn-helix domain
MTEQNQLGSQNNETIVQNELLNKLHTEIIALKTALNVSPKYMTYTCEQVEEILQISKKTLSNYRVNGLIEFSQIGSVIRFTEDNIKKFMSDNYYKSFKPNKHVFN